MIFEREYEPEHYEIAVNLNNLAALKQAQGYYDEAEQLYRRALVIKEKLLGSKHPDVAMTLNNLAVLSKSRGRYVEAEAMYRRALGIFEQSLEPTHPKVVTCRNNCAGLMRKMGQRASQPTGALLQRFGPPPDPATRAATVGDRRGGYWQLLVGTLALLAWLTLAPYTFLSDLAFIFFCGSVLDVAFNGNPLIKLDGYYFLSQRLRMPNLMDRASEWRRGLLRRIVFGVPNEAAARFSRREQAILAVFGSLSFVYTLALRLFIVIFLGSYLTDWFHLPGLLLTAALALFYMRRPLRESTAAAISALRAMATDVNRLFPMRMEANMATQDQTTQALSSGDSGGINAVQKTVEAGEH